MTLHSVPIDIYFHMANHYKKLQNVKSVIDTSSPIAYQKSKSKRRSRPSSRTECSSAKSRTSTSSDRFYNAVSNLYHNANCLSARSQSLPLRPPTRRKSTIIPNFDQDIPTRAAPCPQPCKCLITFFTKADSEKVTTNMDESSVEPLKQPTPAPRTKTRSKESVHGKRSVEHDYLKFSLRIMEDIIRNNLHSNEQMKSVFKTHLEANEGHLDHDKMMQQIKYLQLELNIPDESEDETVLNNKEVIPSIKYGQSPSALSPDLKCECKVLRHLPMVSEKFMAISDKSTKSSISKKTNSYYEEPLFQDESETLLKVTSQVHSVDIILAEPQTHLSRLSSVTEKSETSSTENLSKNVDNISKNTDERIKEPQPEIENSERVEVSIIKEPDFNNIEKEKENLFCICNRSKRSVSISILTPTPTPTLELPNENFSSNQDSIKENELINNDDLDEQALILSSSEPIKVPSLSSINDNYVLIAGPVYVPKAYLNKTTKENYLIVIPNMNDRNNLLLVTKDAGVNTEEQSLASKPEKQNATVNTEEQSILLSETKNSVSTQCTPSCCDMIHKCLNTSTLPKTELNSEKNVGLGQGILWSNSNGSPTAPALDLDCYDLTPERDDNYKNMNPDLILSDKYEIQSNYQIFEITPQLISEFYLDNATQTSEWTIPAEDDKEVITHPKKESNDESSLNVILPSNILLRLKSDPFVKDSKEINFTPENYLHVSLQKEEEDEEEKEEKPLFEESDKRPDSLHALKSNLKNPLNSADSLPMEPDELEEKLKRKHSIKGVSIHVDTTKDKNSDLDTSIIGPPQLKSVSDESESLQKTSQGSNEYGSYEDEGDVLDDLDIMTPLSELEPQPSVLLTMKKVLRSRRSLETNRFPLKTKSVLDEVMQNSPNLHSDSDYSNSWDNLKQKREPDNPVSWETSCCGLIVKNKNQESSKLHSSEQIPEISGVFNDKTEYDKFRRNLSTSTTSLPTNSHI